ncbi:DUF1827 family protein [Enterococcus sp. LJL98]
MRLINVTNSYSRLVLQQLENTDAELVKVYTSGSITVIYTEAPLHNEVVIVNKKRPLELAEIQEIKKYFLNKLTTDEYAKDQVSTIESPGLVEISIPKFPKEKKHRAFG